MNVLVLWEITEEDRRKSEDRGIDIEVIDDDDDERIFPLSQYRLEIDSVAPVEVVEISKLILVKHFASDRYILLIQTRAIR